MSIYFSMMLNNFMKYYELEPKDNHFYSIFVDITHKCNMECANCYTPIRTVPDLDVNRLYEVLAQLPNKAEIRLIGGEPTVRTDLVEIVDNIKRLGHRPTMMTNGLMLARPGYARALADAGMRSIYISMNGADDNSIYKVMDGGGAWAERKVAALKACLDVKMNVNVGAILQKGVNDQVPKRLYEIVKEAQGKAILRFRNVGQVGRYSLEKDQNWTWDEMVTLVCNQFGIDEEWAKTQIVINGCREENVIFFPVEADKKYTTSWIKITDWSPADSDFPDPGNDRRGRLTQDFKLAPFFEHVKKYENQF
jgi:molybdenum cofactor biosynthesis enzyme MoaA